MRSVKSQQSLGIESSVCACLYEVKIGKCEKPSVASNQIQCVLGPVQVSTCLYACVYMCVDLNLHC